MKRFDTAAIKERLMARIKVNTEWAQFIDDGVVSNLIDDYSEGLAELARYLEYLTGEKKWSTARNMSSLTSMAKLISRKPRRPVSAAGFIIVSHTDDTGVDRLANYGRTFFDLDDTSDYDDLVQSETSTSTMAAALVPWTNSTSYVVPKGTIFTSSSGVPFISTKAVYSRHLSQPYSEISENSTKLAAFKKAGGWNGIKYLKIPVIQGEQKEVVLGTASGTKFETFTIDGQNVEDASNSMSEDFFYITVTDNSGETSETWEEISNIRLAGPYDKVFEATTTDDGTNLIIKFGDGVSGHLLTAKNTITLHYLESLGSSGNIDSKYQITTMAFPKNSTMVDPRTNSTSTFLSCLNISSLLGGKDAESEDDFKENAPVSYVKSYATATKKEYEEKIMKYSPVSLLRLKVFPTSSYETDNLDVSIDDKYAEVSNEYTTIKNTLNITAIQANGEKIEDADDTFIEPILESISNLKGPNDSLAYCEPNYIKLYAGVVVNTTSTKYTEAEIKSYVSTAILNKYSIFNTDFKNKLCESVLISSARNFPFSDSIDVEMEALANVDVSSLKLIKREYSGDRTKDNLLVAIPFSFDTIYGSNKYLKGFKNYSVNSGFLIKANFEFTSSSKSSKNRTLFLLDNRKDQDTMPSLQEGKNLAIDDDSQIPEVKYSISDTSSGIDINLYDETSEYFSNRQVRVAQFPIITNVTNDTFMIKAKDFSLQPYELRPYVVDTDGKNKVFTSSNVNSAYRASIDGASIDTICYKVNSSYVNYMDINFTEDYDDTSSVNYASGYLIVPLTYFDLDLSELDLTNTTDGTVETSIATAISSVMTIKVFARPQMHDIQPSNWNDIAFIDDSDIVVERNYSSQDN